MLDLEPAAREVARLLDGVTGDQLSDPTPCAGIQVAGLLVHLMGLSQAFTWAAHKSTPPEGGSPGSGLADAEHLDPCWREVLPQRLTELVQAWRDPKAWEGVTEAGGVRMPAESMGVVALDELVLHGWDLARATGQPYECDAASAEACFAFTAQVPDDPEAREGLFGPVVDVPADAPLFDRVLGLSGRDPAWTP
jgi:uncharacterized protein (TIGR03086 family)